MQLQLNSTTKIGIGISILVGIGLIFGFSTNSNSNISENEQLSEIPRKDYLIDPRPIPEKLESSKIIPDPYSPELKIKDEDSITRTITYEIDTLPDIPDKQLVYTSLEEGISKWEELNNIDFVKTDGTADIRIHWLPISPEEHQGLAEYYTKYQGDIKIGLGKYNCKDEYVQFDRNRLQTIVMHEIGHILGLEHVSDENHLMYGTDHIVSIEEMQNSGYVIPQKTEGYYVGFELLQNEYDELSVKLDATLPKINQMKSDYERVYSEYSDYYEQYQYNTKLSGVITMYEKKLNQLDSQLNHSIDEYNSEVTRLNDLVNEMNCFPDTEALVE